MIYPYYDKNGKNITLQEYLELLNDESYRIVKRTLLPGGINVSTVWLGLDHSLFSESPHDPIIFETIIFPDCKEMRRYCTLEEAVKGHEEMVAEQKAKIA